MSERERNEALTPQPNPDQTEPASLILNIVPDDLSACSVATLTMWGENRWLGGTHTQNASRLQQGRLPNGKTPCLSCLFLFLHPSLCVFYGYRDLEPPWESILIDFAGNIYMLFLDWMPRLRLWKKLSSLRVFSGYGVTQSCLLAMAGCPVIYQTDCGKADWKLTVDSLADLFCVSWRRGQLLPKRRQQES